MLPGTDRGRVIEAEEREWKDRGGREKKQAKPRGVRQGDSEQPPEDHPGLGGTHRGAAPDWQEGHLHGEEAG